jgi:hypothetical protein
MIVLGGIATASTANLPLEALYRPERWWRGVRGDGGHIWEALEVSDEEAPVPFLGVSAVDIRREFVMLAQAEGASVRELCRHYGVSPDGGLQVAQPLCGDGRGRACERSRRPRRSPKRTGAELEQRILELRAAHPAWGGRKLRRRLQDLGAGEVPGASHPGFPGLLLKPEGPPGNDRGKCEPGAGRASRSDSVSGLRSR